MKLFLSLIFTFTCLNLEAQQVWKKNYLVGHSNKFSLIEFGDHTYMMGVGNGFLKLDSAGNIIWQRSFNVFANPGHASDLQYINSIEAINDTLFCFDAATQNSCFGDSVFAPGIFIADSTGNILAKKKYRFNAYCLSFPTQISHNLRGGFALSGISGPAFIPHAPINPIVLCTDSSLDVKWAKYISSFRGATQFTHQISDGSFIIGFNLDSVGVVIARTDSMGNFLWCKSYFRPRGAIYNFTSNDDGTFVVTGFTDSVNVGLFGIYPPGFNPSMFMMKLDTTGNVLWCKKIDVPHHNFGGWVINWADVKRTNDGGYILTGAAGINAHAYALLIKTDANGDTVWTRWHGTSNYHQYKESVFTDTDNGFLIGGTSYGSFPHAWGAAAYLYKTDSLGYSTCDQNWDSVYFNNLIVNDSNVVLNSIDGAIALPVTVTDSVYAPFDVYNTCLITDIPRVISSFEQKMKFYPNPNTGKITIQTNSTRKKNVVVYNSNGLLILEMKNISDSEIFIDLIKRPKGIYLVKVLDGNKTSESKVVVQ